MAHAGDVPVFHFEPVARLQRFLGNELIADPNLAITEFVKNAYDAEASDVYLDFAVAGRTRDKQVITISDNGSGMDRHSFETNWMRPGYSYKAGLKQPVGPDGVVRRVPVGEKGLGRLAAGRIATLMHVYTRTTEDQPWLHVFIDWTRFDSMDELLSDVPVPYDEISAPTSPRVRSGTIVVLEGLTIDWASKLPGRKVQRKSQYRLGRLQEDLSILLQPLPLGQRDFSLHLWSDSPELEHINGPVSPSEAKLLDYQFELAVSETEGRILISRRVRRGTEIAERTGKEDVTEQQYFVRESAPNSDLEDLPKSLVCGPFSGVIYYSPLSGGRLKQLGVRPGVFLYRDSVRVEPYGQEGDDWLGATAWKASRQGYAPIQPKYLGGYFTIRAVTNPDLRDMSNRQGLVDNDAYRAFLALARHEFRWFAELVFKEYVEPKWEPLESKAQRAAQRAQAFGVSIIRAMAHSIAQSTAGLSADLGALRLLMSRCSVPEELIGEFAALEERSWAHLKRIDDTIQRFLQFDQQQLTAIDSYEDVSLQEILAEAVSRAQPLARSKGVKLLLDPGSQDRIVFAKEVLITAIVELVSNAIEAAYAARYQDGWVKVSAERQLGQGHSILIQDNGHGVDPTRINELLSGQTSTKGRPGAGLLLTREALTLAGGQLSLHASNSEGATFKVSLPSGKDLRQ